MYKSASNNSNNLFFFGTCSLGIDLHPMVIGLSPSLVCQANNHGWWSIPRLHCPIKSHYCTIGGTHIHISQIYWWNSPAHGRRLEYIAQGHKVAVTGFEPMLTQANRLMGKHSTNWATTSSSMTSHQKPNTDLCLVKGPVNPPCMCVGVCM